MIQHLFVNDVGCNREHLVMQLSQPVLDDTWKGMVGLLPAHNTSHLALV